MKLKTIALIGLGYLAHDYFQPCIKRPAQPINYSGTFSHGSARINRKDPGNLKEYFIALAMNKMDSLFYGEIDHKPSYSKVYKEFQNNYEGDEK